MTCLFCCNEIDLRDVLIDEVRSDRRSLVLTPRGLATRVPLKPRRVLRFWCPHCCAPLQLDRADVGAREYAQLTIRRLE